MLKAWWSGKPAVAISTVFGGFIWYLGGCRVSSPCFTW